MCGLALGAEGFAGRPFPLETERMYLVQLAGVAEARWLCGPDSPLADPDRRPLTGSAMHLGGGLVRLDGDAVQALAALPPHMDGHITWDDGPVLQFGRDSFPLVQESSTAQTRA